eukprot:TRINITY_DN761_c0_g1_i4.p4 TRINITY_DN761_c0_g1~~TRINITY_DN761_c0_g1_i4.p4  ORF type:complete len:145 (-),score=0.12 TRINITY_DN761_c0_g1_i4:647-1039(-)
MRHHKFNTQLNKRNTKMEYTQTPLLPPTQPAAHPIGVPVVAQPSPIVVVPAAEPRDLLQNVTAVYFTEDRNPGFLSSSLAYSVCDYSNTLRGNTLFSGFMIDNIASQFKYFSYSLSLQNCDNGTALRRFG